MRARWILGIAVSAALAVVSLLAQPQGDASKGKGQGASAKGGGVGLYQRQPPTPTGPAPKLADGTPDLSGVWLGSGANDADISTALKPGDSVVMLPWAEALVKTRQSKDDPEANCLPAGIPRGSPYPWRIVQTPAHLLHPVRGQHPQLPADLHGRRKHPDDPDPYLVRAFDRALGRATRWWWTRSGSTTSSGSTTRAIRTPNSSTPSSATRAPIWGTCRSR